MMKFKPSHIYLSLAVLGTILPCSQFILFLSEQGINVDLFYQQLFATRISTFFALDVFICVFSIITFTIIERKDIQRSHIPIFVAATIFVGPSLVFPLILYFRAREKEKMDKTYEKYEQETQKRNRKERGQAQKKTTYTIDGKVYDRIKCGDEKHVEWESCHDQCGDCAVITGDYHVLGCENDECPKCKRQAITCKCDYGDDHDKVKMKR